MDEIRDSAGNLLATIVDDGSGTTTIYDVRGNALGFSNVNGTFDFSGQLISNSPGQLALLIPRM